MTPADLRATCVVVAFHDAPSLDRMLGRLRHPALEVLVVNVDGDPDVGRVAARHAAGNLALPGNPGYAAAVNRGAAAATTPVIVFMNDDVDVEPATVVGLADVVASGSADVAVPAVVTPTGNFEPTIAALPTPRTLAVEWLMLPDRPVPGLRRLLPVQKWRSPSSAERVAAASAVVVAARAELLSRLPLPEEYFLYWEESEWFWWLRRHGAVVEFHPELRVVHRGGRTEVRSDKSRLLARNAVLCVRRTQGRLTAAASVPVVIAWNVRLTLVAALRAAGRGPAERAVLRARLAGLRAAVGSWSAAV